MRIEVLYVPGLNPYGVSPRPIASAIICNIGGQAQAQAVSAICLVDSI